MLLVGCAFKEETDDTAYVLSAPTSLVATGGAQKVTLDWKAVSGASSYTIYWDNVSGISSSDTAITAVSTDNYTHSNLDNGTTYYYKVAAVDSSGNGPLSSEVNATTDNASSGPVFTSSSTATVAENQTTAITLVATDEQTITYSISGTDSALFSINSSTGVVTFATAPDYESPSDSDTNNTYAFTATATDSRGLATTQSVVVTVTDVADMTAGGVTYSTVTIGSQTWTVNNMAHAPSNSSVNTLNTHYWNGYSGSGGSAADEDGYYYTWDAAMNNSTTEEAQGICASGWHIPDDADWAVLEEAAVDGASGVDWLNTTDWRGTDEGTQLKAGGTSNFNAKLTGFRTSSSFNNRGNNTALWSSTESGSSAYVRHLATGYATVDRNVYSKSNGYSVRCLKD